jgi:DNA repair protein RadA/Sms
MARKGAKCLVVSAEESPAQVQGRAARMDGAVPGVWLTSVSSVLAVQGAVAEIEPDVLVVDSIQTIFDPEIDSPPGSVAQVRGCAHRLTAAAKSGGPATLLVGHVTKEGTLAGPRVLEHLVDTVLSFEGDRHHALRLLRAVKHRFGPCGELGLFEMTARGLSAVADAGRMFLGDRRVGVPGSVVFPSVEGQRPMLVEIQALVAPSYRGAGGSSDPAGRTGGPQRSASGFPLSRLSLLLAVLDRRAGLSFAGQDVYLSVIGGVKVADPGADLAVCVALASALTDRAVDPGTVIVGEVGLAGEIRQVAHTVRRLVEAERMGFGRAVVPPVPVPVVPAGPAGAHPVTAATATAGTPAGTAATGAPPGLELCPVTDLVEALAQHLGRVAAPPRLRLVH